MSNNIRKHYKPKIKKRKKAKTEELSYLEEDTRLIILKEVLKTFGIKSRVHEFKSEYIENYKSCLVGIEDYYLRTTCQDYEVATREYIILLTSWLLTHRWKLNVNLVKNKPALNNALLFETCEFKYK